MSVFFDIRLGKIGDEIEIFHGDFEQVVLLEGVLKFYRNFLTKHPAETILMRVQQEYSKLSGDAFQKMFDGYVDGKGYRSLFHSASTFPALGQARGKVVLMSSYPYLGYGLHYGDGDFDVQDDYADPTESDKKKIKDQFDRAASVASKSKLFINYLSATGASTSDDPPSSIRSPPAPMPTSPRGHRGRSPRA